MIDAYDRTVEVVITTDRRTIQIMRIIVTLYLSVGAAIPKIASASTAEYGYVTNLTMEESSWVNFTQNRPRTSLPACTADARWSLDASTDYGRARLAALLTAMTSNKRIYIAGTGVCGAFGVETINYFTVEN